MTDPRTPLDVDLEGWLDGIGFKPADTRAKQVGHQAAREFVASLGAVLHGLLPAGRDKSIVFTLLEDVLMRANRALALGGGPADQSDEAVAELAAQIAASPIGLPRDHRYEAEQRGEVVEVQGVPAPEATEILTLRTPNARATLHQLTQDSRKSLLLTVDELDGGVAEIEMSTPRLAEELASALLTGRNAAWAPEA